MSRACLSRFKQLRAVADDNGYTIDELLEAIPELTTSMVEKEEYKKKVKAMSNKVDMYKQRLAERDAQLRQVKSTTAPESDDESSDDDDGGLPFDKKHLSEGITTYCSNSYVLSSVE